MAADIVRLAMPRKPVILFDWGGVISSGGIPDEITARLERVLGIDRAAIKKLSSPILAKLKRGKLSIDDFWDELETTSHQKIPENMRNIWAPLESLKPESSMQEFTKELTNRGYKVGILSNVFPNTEEMIRDAGWYRPYQPLFLSSELGMAKPDHGIYEYVCRELNRKPEDVIFIDDQQRCLDPAASIGMRVVLAHNPTQIIHDVRILLGIS